MIAELVQELRVGPQEIPVVQEKHELYSPYRQIDVFVQAWRHICAVGHGGIVPVPGWMLREIAPLTGVTEDDVNQTSTPGRATSNTGAG